MSRSSAGQREQLTIREPFQSYAFRGYAGAIHIPKAGFYVVDGDVVGRPMAGTQYEQMLAMVRAGELPEPPIPFARMDALDARRFLVENTPDGVRRSVAVSDLIRDDELLQRFSGLKLTEHSIVLFAKRYGFLGIPQEIVTADSSITIQGEAVSRWFAEAAEFKVLRQLSKWLKEKNLRKLEPLVAWTGDHVHFCVIDRYGIIDEAQSKSRCDALKEKRTFEIEPIEGMNFTSRVWTDPEDLDRFSRAGGAARYLGPVAAYVHERIGAKVGRIRFRSMWTRPGETYFEVDTVLRAIYIRFHRDQAADAIVPLARLCREETCDQLRDGNSPFCSGHRKERQDALARKRYHENNYNQNRRQQHGSASPKRQRRRRPNEVEVDVADQTRVVTEWLKYPAFDSNDDSNVE